MKTSLIGIFCFAVTLSALAAKNTHQPMVVGIDAYHCTPTDKACSASRSGLGFVFEAEGFILSSYSNLLDDNARLANHLSVTLPGRGKPYPAEIVGVEPTLNLSILKVFSEEPLHDAKLLSLEALHTGQEIWIDEGPSNKRKSAGRLVGLNSRECYQESMTSTMLRGELSVSPKQIGAPVINHAGDVVAIYTGYTPADSSDHQDEEEEIYLLPSQLALNIYESLKHKKSMKSPWTGFSVMAISEEQKKYFPTKHGDRAGIAIESVWDKSPAQKLGIIPGDILVRFGHYRIESPADFQKWLYMYGVGHRVKLVLLREGQYLIKDYTIEERPLWALPK